MDCTLLDIDDIYNIDSELFQKDLKLRQIISTTEENIIIVVCKNRFYLQNIYTKLCFWINENMDEYNIYIYDNYYFNFYYDNLIESVTKQHSSILVTNELTNDMRQLHSHIIYY